jgi:cytochrome c-type biogenesis protein CcmH
MNRAAFLGLALFFGALSPALAVRPDELLTDPGLEARARGISAQLRCMVCQNQSIDDSDAPLARDLRVLVRERLKDGDSDDAVRTYLTARYGDFILLKPPLKWETALLWIGPGLLLLIGAAALVVWTKRGRPVGTAHQDLNGEERAALEILLARSDPVNPASR